MSQTPEFLLALQKIGAEITPQTRVTVMTGAGISAASGIPTFRGAQDSLWSQYRPEELATNGAFENNPELVWRWYDWRRGLIAGSSPNDAHYALVDLAAISKFTLITQNVDGYHQAAGSTGVLEFHGSIWKTRCRLCGFETLDQRVPIPILPECEKCGGLTRPGVVWFGEGIDPQIMQDAVDASSNCDIFLVIGTAGAVHPAASMVEIAKRAGAYVIELNLERSGISHLADLFVPGSAADTLSQFIPGR